MFNLNGYKEFLCTSLRLEVGNTVKGFGYGQFKRIKKCPVDFTVNGSSPERVKGSVYTG